LQPQRAASLVTAVYVRLQQSQTLFIGYVRAGGLRDTRLFDFTRDKQMRAMMMMMMMMAVTKRLTCGREITD